MCRWFGGTLRLGLASLGTPVQSVAGAGARSLVRQNLRAHYVCVAAIALELCSCLGCASFPRCRTGTREFLGLHHAPASSAARVGSGAVGGRRAFS